MPAEKGHLLIVPLQVVVAAVAAVAAELHRQPAPVELEFAEAEAVAVVVPAEKILLKFYQDLGVLHRKVYAITH